MKTIHNLKVKTLSIFAVLMMVMVTLAIPMSSDDSEGASSTWTYTISISGNTSTVSISGVTDGKGNATENLTSSGVGSWGWDENSEYGPFGSYYAAFNSSGNIMYHVRADDLNTKVGSAKGTNDVDKTYNIMWVLPTVYWNVDSSGNLILSNDSSKGTAYAHTIDGTVYPYLAIGVYETYLDSSSGSNVAKSLSGQTPAYSKTRPVFRTASEYTIDTDADGTDNGYSMQWNYYQWSLYRYCTFATLGTFNSQSFATGPTSGNSSSTTGLTNTSTTSTPGYYANGSSSVRLFLENAWGSVYEFVDNVYVNNCVWYVGQTHNASDNTTNKQNIGTMPSSDGYIKTIQTSANNWGLPASTEASDTTGLCDYYWYNSGECSVFVGGDWGDGTGAGVSCFDASASLDFSDGVAGSRLSFVFDADPASNSQSGGEITIDPIDTQYSIVNGSVSFNVSSTPTSVTYTASEITDGLTVSISGTAITCSATTAGTYTFTLTASATNYKSDSTTVTVIVDPILAFTNSVTSGELTVKGA